MEDNTQKNRERISRINHRSLALRDHMLEKSRSRISGLSTTEISVLRILCEDPHKIMKEVGEELHIGKSTLTGIIDRLEKRGYLRRVINPRDRRSFGLEITGQGKTAQQEHLRIEQDCYGAMAEFLKQSGHLDLYLDLSEQMLEALEKGLRKDGM